MSEIYKYNALKVQNAEELFALIYLFPSIGISLFCLFGSCIPCNITVCFHQDSLLLYGIPDFGNQTLYIYWCFCGAVFVSQSSFYLIGKHIIEVLKLLTYLEDTIRFSSARCDEGHNITAGSIGKL